MLMWMLREAWYWPGAAVTSPSTQDPDSLGRNRAGATTSQAMTAKRKLPHLDGLAIALLDTQLPSVEELRIKTK